MTKDQRLYWYRVGREQCIKGLEEPEHGRASKQEEQCWWAGWYSIKAGLPDAYADEPSAPQRCFGCGSVVEPGSPRYCSAACAERT